MSVELKEKPESKTVSQEEQLTDGFHLLIDALKMNDLNTIYGVPGIPITDLRRPAEFVCCLSGTNSMRVTPLQLPVTSRKSPVSV